MDILDEEIKDDLSNEGDKLTAILAYLTFIGFVVALILNAKKSGAERTFNAYHLRQGLGLIAVEFLMYAVFKVVETVLLSISMSLFYFAVKALEIGITLAVLGFVFMGVMNALNGRKKTLPVVGKYVARFLKNAFN